MTFEAAEGERQMNISIHMPHTWHDTTHWLTGIQGDAFQSTCHIRGMTLVVVETDKVINNFNPHATYVA